MFSFNWGMFWAILAALAVRGSLNLLASFWGVGSHSILYKISGNVLTVNESIQRIEKQLKGGK